MVGDGAELARVLKMQTSGTSNEVGRYCKLADLLRKAFGADFGLLVGDFPVVGSDEENFHVTLSGPLGVDTVSLRYAGHPDILEERAAKQALDLLRLKLLGV